MKQGATAAVIFFALLATVACSSKDEEGKSTGSTCPTGSALTYDNFGKAFFDANCLSCHTSREKPTLTSVAAIRANASAIDREAAAGPNGTNTAMPESGSVSVEDRKKLGEWLACGAP